MCTVLNLIFLGVNVRVDVFVQADHLGCGDDLVAQGTDEEDWLLDLGNSL